jgi:hypothetical protein
VTQTLYAYVDGADLEEVEALIERRLSAFITTRTWIADPQLVNQRHARNPRDQPDDLPLWDLGVNLVIPDGSNRTEWFGDLESLVRELAALHAQVGRNFVVGIYDSESGVAEDLFFVDSESPSIQSLREIIGVP